MSHKLLVLFAAAAVVLVPGVQYAHGWPMSADLLDPSIVARLTSLSLKSSEVASKTLEATFIRVQGSLQAHLPVLDICRVLNTVHIRLGLLCNDVRHHIVALMRGIRHWWLRTYESFVAMSQIEGANDIFIVLGVVHLASILVALKIWSGIQVKHNTPRGELVKAEEAAVIPLQILMTAAANGVIADLAPLIRAAARPELLQHLQSKNIDKAILCLDWEQDIQGISAIAGVGFEDNPNVGKSHDYNNLQDPYRRECKTCSIALALMLLCNITLANARQLLQLLPAAVTVDSRPNDFKNRCQRLCRSEAKYKAAWKSCEEVIQATVGYVSARNEYKNVKAAAVLVAALLLQKLA